MKSQAQSPARAPHSSTVRRAMRTVAAIAMLAVSIGGIAATKSFELLKITQLSGKGRVQDQGYAARDPQVAAILASGKNAIPQLIEALLSERPFVKPPMPFWPEMVEGDLALAVLSDLFLDPTWKRSTLPELCWDSILGRTSVDAPAWVLLNDFVKSHGREALAARWRQAWLEHGGRVIWDASGQYFRVEGLELSVCAPDASLEPTR
jgi:hypothetical protein